MYMYVVWCVCVVSGECGVCVCGVWCDECGVMWCDECGTCVCVVCVVCNECGVCGVGVYIVHVHCMYTHAHRITYIDACTSD